jgi:CRISPR-associated endonuclease/helicase Cas3
MVKKSIYIKSKSNGLDLFDHSSAVYETCKQINKMGKYGLDNNVIYWFGLLHDLGKANPLFQSNMNTNNFDNICRHEISSLLFIDIVPKHIRKIVGYMVLSHHKSLKDETRSFFNLYNEDETFYINHIGNIKVWGLLIKDYLKFHYDINIEILSYYEYQNILDEYIDGINELNKGASEYRAVGMMGDHFASCYSIKKERNKIIKTLYKKPNISFYKTKNNKYPLSLINSDNTKSHTFVVAPTGSGKTNFMMKRIRNRVFYTLPFQASINAMFNRIKGDIGGEIGIKHASSKAIESITETTKTLSDFFGLPVKIMTPYQIMGILYGIKGYEITIMDLKGQDIILDEIHTYKDLAQTNIIHLIETLVFLGCHVHICTATMPSSLKNEILNILGRDNTQIVELPDETLDTFNRHIIHTVDSFNLDDIITHYNNGEKVIVTRNKVDSAIKTYTELKNKCPNAKIMLLHSRFKRGDRNLLENKLINDFNAKSEPCILVSTQVIEVSLDINFDIMFTDNADIMALIQRFGRINRQRKTIGVLKDIYIVNTDSFSDTLPYNYEISKKSFNEISKYNDKILEEKNIQKIIDEIYKDEKLFKNENLGNPFNNNIWKYRMFCNTSEKLSSILEISGMVGVLKSEVSEYQKHANSKYEIPLKNDKLFGITLSPINQGTFKYVYVIPDEFYYKELGLFKKNK